MQKSTRPLTHLSDVFKYVSHYRRKGHQIGRKVGDMLEVLTTAVLVSDERIFKRLVVEPKLEGFSGAAHKVEFAVCENPTAHEGPLPVDDLLAFIECKRVGVEQTVNQGFKNRFSRKGNRVPYGDCIEFSLNPRWSARSVRFNTEFLKNKVAKLRVSMDNNVVFFDTISSEQRFIYGLTVEGMPFFLRNDQSLRDVPDSVGVCKILEIQQVNDGDVLAMLNDCLAGPQTPEKAKQASFVALDLRKGRFGQFDKREAETEMVSIMIMTELSHWEEKSRNMIRASIDYNLTISDDIIISAFEEFEKAFGDHFIEQVTKDKVLYDLGVSQLCKRIVEKYDYKVFCDLDTGAGKTIGYDRGSIVVY